MIDPGRFFLGHIRQVVMAAENLAHPAPERVLIQHALYVANGIFIRRIKAAHQGRKPLPRLGRQAKNLVGKNLIRLGEIVARGVVIQVVVRRPLFEGFPLFFKRYPENDGLRYSARVHGLHQPDHAVGFLNKIDKMQVGIDNGNDRLKLGMSYDLIVKS
jgi:hypothetical protein